jgi:hypothetical protein
MLGPLDSAFTFSMLWLVWLSTMKLWSSEQKEKLQKYHTRRELSQAMAGQHLPLEVAMIAESVPSVWPAGLLISAAPSSVSNEEGGWPPFFTSMIKTRKALFAQAFL